MCQGNQTLRRRRSYWKHSISTSSLLPSSHRDMSSNTCHVGVRGWGITNARSRTGLRVVVVVVTVVKLTGARPARRPTCALRPTRAYMRMDSRRRTFKTRRAMFASCDGQRRSIPLSTSYPDHEPYTWSPPNTCSSPHETGMMIAGSSTTTTSTTTNLVPLGCRSA